MSQHVPPKPGPFQFNMVVELGYDEAIFDIACVQANTTVYHRVVVGGCLSPHLFVR